MCVHVCLCVLDVRSGRKRKNPKPRTDWLDSRVKASQRNVRKKVQAVENKEKQIEAIRTLHDEEMKKIKITHTKTQNKLIDSQAAQEAAQKQTNELHSLTKKQQTLNMKQEKINKVNEKLLQRKIQQIESLTTSLQTRLDNEQNMKRELQRTTAQLKQKTNQNKAQNVEIDRALNEIETLLAKLEKIEDELRVRGEKEVGLVSRLHELRRASAARVDEQVAVTEARVRGELEVERAV